MKKNIVSIILSTYNGNHNWIIQSIDSVLSQSFNDFELIIINDCSTNDIEKTILKYKQNDNRIIYVKNKNNLGVVKSRNKGLSIAKGKYIAIIDDDDIWHDNNKLKKQVEFMKKNPDYGVCGTGVILINENGEKIYKIVPYSNNDIIKNKILALNMFTHSSILFKNEKYFYDKNYKYIEDYELILRIGTKYKLYNIQEYLTKYRVKGKGVSSDNLKIINKLRLKVIFKYRNNYNNFYKALGINFIKLLIPQYFYKKLLNIYLKIKNANK